MQPSVPLCVVKEPDNKRHEVVECATDRFLGHSRRQMKEMSSRFEVWHARSSRSRQTLVVERGG